MTNLPVPRTVVRRNVVDAPDRVDSYLRSAFAQGRVVGGPINGHPHVGRLTDGRAFAVLDVYEPTTAWPVQPARRVRTGRKDPWAVRLVCLLALMACLVVVLAVISLVMFVSWCAAHLALLIGIGAVVFGVPLVLGLATGRVHCPGCPR